MIRDLDSSFKIVSYFQITYMKPICTLIICFFLLQNSFSQTVVKDTVKTTVTDSIQKIARDSIVKAKEDSVKWAKMEAKLIYPLLKAGTWSGVLPVPDADEIPDPSISYKLLFELVLPTKAKESKDINHGLTEICRLLNLHVASGIAVKKITPVIVVHGSALFAFYNNEFYQKKFKTDNPNIAVIEELIKKTGARFIACGQAMQFLEIQHSELIPQMKVSVTAQTVLSHYQLKGYKLYEIAEDK